MGSFADSFLRVITSITILFGKSLTLKPGAIHYQEKYWHIIHQMKSLKENWIISIKQLKCSIYYCNLREKDFNKFKKFISKKYYSDLMFLGDISLYMNGEGSMVAHQMSLNKIEKEWKHYTVIYRRSAIKN